MGEGKLDERLKGKGAGNASHRPPSHAAQVKSKVERSKGSHRWLQWMSGVESASVSDLPGLARMAKGNPGALRMIAYRWIELDPQHLLETLRAEGKYGDHDGEGLAFPIRELSRRLFEEWPKRDPEAAIAALGTSDSLPGVNGLRFTVLNTVFCDDPRRGLELMRTWSIQNYAPSMSGVEKWAGDDPRAAVQAVLDHPAGYGARSSMETIAKVWAGSDPHAAMEFALEVEGRLGEILRATALAEWAGRDWAAAAEWLGEQENDARRSELSPVIVEGWAKEDPQAALAWCEENLEGHHLITAVAKLAEGAAANDLAGAGALVAGMEASPARTQAAIAVGKKWFRRDGGMTERSSPRRWSGCAGWGTRNCRERCWRRWPGDGRPMIETASWNSSAARTESGPRARSTVS